jgi:hypothetical protein
MISAPPVTTDVSACGRRFRLSPSRTNSQADSPRAPSPRCLADPAGLTARTTPKVRPVGARRTSHRAQSGRTMVFPGTAERHSGYDYGRSCSRHRSRTPGWVLVGAVAPRRDGQPDGKGNGIRWRKAGMAGAWSDADHRTRHIRDPQPLVPWPTMMIVPAGQTPPRPRS